MCCLVLLASGLGPRIVLALWWIFGEKVDLAFDTFIWPLLGLLLLPWTTLFYVIAWSAVGGQRRRVAARRGRVVLDVMTYSARKAQAMYGTRTGYWPRPCALVRKTESAKTESAAQTKAGYDEPRPDDQPRR